MNTATGNPKRTEQQTQAAQSRLKTPATETAHASRSEAREAEQKTAVVQATDKEADQGAGKPAADAAASPAEKAAHSVAQANRVQLKQALPPAVDPAASQTKASRDPAMSTDLRNGAGLDNTVDTDGKNREAMLDRPANFPNVVGVSASPVDSVVTAEVGLAGFDSRPGGNLPAIATGDSHQLEHHGTADEVPAWRTQGNGAGVEQDNLPANGTRVTRIVHITPKKKS